MNDSNDSMRKITVSHNKMALILVPKQELLKKHSKLGSLWKLQEYYVTVNQFEKMQLVMTQIMAMKELLTQRNDEPDDVIKIKCEGSDNDKLNHGDSKNNDDIDIESVEGQESVDNAEEVE